MLRFISWIEALIAAVWMVMIVNLFFPWPAPYEFVFHLLMQITLATHLSLCAGVRIRYGKPLTLKHYRDLLIFGVLALIVWQNKPVDPPKVKEE